MKKLKQVLIFSIVLTLILSSCSMEKRQYMPGYYISSNLSQSHELSAKNKSGNAEKTRDKNNVDPIIPEQTETASSDNSQNDNALTASTDNSITFHSTPKIYLQKNKNKVVSDESPQTSETKKIVKTERHKKEKKKSLGSDGGTNGLAIASFICGIAWTLFLWFGIFGAVLALIGSIPAIVMGFIALGQIKKSEDSHEGGNQGGKGLAIAGIVGGFLGLFFSFLVILLIALLFAV